LQSGPSHKRLQLEVGTIHAAIWAPPGEFVVDTPSAIAVDLGCAYTLHVTPDGSGTIRTILGWVGFHLNGRDSFIPAGAMCSTRPKVGPGTPYFEDVSESFREALHTFDRMVRPLRSLQFFHSLAQKTASLYGIFSPALLALNAWRSTSASPLSFPLRKALRARGFSASIHTCSTSIGTHSISATSPSGANGNSPLTPTLLPRLSNSLRKKSCS